MSFFTALLFSLFVLTRLLCVRSLDEDDLEVVLLPTEWNSNSNATTVALTFSAFGKKVNLLLRRNEQLVARNFEVWKRENDGLSHINASDYAKYSSCHYLHENSYSSAAVSLCDAGIVKGFVFLENDSLEISPLNDDEVDKSRIMLYKSQLLKVRSGMLLLQPHVIKRRRISSLHDKFRMSPARRQESSSYDDDSGEIKPVATETLTIELALFFDETAYKTFKPHFSGDDAKLLDLLLAYVNNIQALYHHPSLGQRIDLALVRLELMKSQPQELAHLEGERSEALEAFCKYSEMLNPQRDEDPKHWDMGIYVSGLDFYAMENGTKSPVTMGLAPVGGVCWNRYACVIAEFGVNNKFGRPFPSAGFTSVYIAAHEMAHNLGMHHDSTGNDCPKDGFIMSPSRGVKGETQWSKCSREVALSLSTSKTCLLDKPGINYFLEPHRHLDHRGRFNELPGRRYWPAKRQCELLLRDRDAFVDTLENCCTSLKCKTPNRMGFFLAGPALDGTKCDEDKECRAGDCLPINDKWKPVSTIMKPATTSPKPIHGWSSWHESSCESGCIRGSLGFIERRRTCRPSNEESSELCTGLNFDVILCKDAKVCKTRKRLSAAEHAGLRCLEFKSRGIEVIDANAGGLQVEHEPERPWFACAVFCKRRDIASYYTAREQLVELGVDPYFPDGTWCHRENGQDYFCRRHHCLPENFRFGKDTMSLKDEKNLMESPAIIEPRYLLSLHLNGNAGRDAAEGSRSYEDETAA